MAKILITGASGQLGNELKDLFTNNERLRKVEVIYTDWNSLDITDKSAVDKVFSGNDIAVVINCAGYTAVDKAEDEPELCYAVNAKAAGFLAEAVKRHDAYLIHISTDYIFDGESSTPYTEEFHPNPATVYGKSKLEGEELIVKSGANYVILRTSWLYSVYGNNFPKTILKASAQKESLNVVSDQIGTPTYAADLAEVAGKLAYSFLDSFLKGVTSGIPSGIYHYSNEGVCSWYDFAHEILKMSGSTCKVRPITSDLYPTKAKRPSYSVLDKTRIKQIIETEIPHWRDSLTLFYKKLIERKER